MMEHLATLDATLSQQLTLSSESTWWRLAKVLAHLGDGQYIFSGLGLVYLLGWLWGGLRLRWATIVIALTVLTAMLIVSLIKFMVRRQRPRPPGEFVTFQYDKYSFPSGHAVRLAALAVSTTFFYPPLGWLLVGTALSVAAARVAVGIHYVSDIVVGLSLGVLVAWGTILIFLPLLPTFS